MAEIFWKIQRNPEDEQNHFIPNEIEYDVLRSVSRPNLRTIRPRGRLLPDHLGALFGLAALYGGTHRIVHFDLADVDDLGFELADAVRSHTALWKLKFHFGRHATLVGLTNYAHCPRLLLHLLAWPQDDPDDRLSASCTFLSVRPGRVPDGIPDVTSAAELRALWCAAARSRRTRRLAGRGGDAPITLDVVRRGSGLRVRRASEQRCVTCGFPVARPIARALRGETDLNPSIPGPSGASGCFACPRCGGPVVVDFGGNVLPLEQPRVALSPAFLSGALASIEPADVRGR